MICLAVAEFTNSISTEAVRITLDYSLKSGLLCLVVWLLTVAMRKKSAHLRGKMWVFTLVGLAVLPLLSVLAPVWKLPLLPDLQNISSWFGGANSSSGKISPVSKQIASEFFPSAGDVAQAGDQSSSLISHWSHWILLALILGSVLVLTWTVLSRITLRRISSEAQPLDQQWMDLLESLSEKMQLKRSVRLLKTSAVNAGITTGTFKPLIILPISAENWSANRRRLIMAHELAHIQRKDALIEDLAALVFVLNWFNPLVWLAIKRMRVEREMDCDNVVINSGAKPSDYALQLMEVASDIGAPTNSQWQPVWISQNSNLRDRLMHILDPGAMRNTSGHLAVAMAAVFMFLVTIPLAATSVWNETPEQRSLTNIVLGQDSEKYWSMDKSKDESAAYLIERIIAGAGISEAEVAIENVMTKATGDRRYYMKEKQFNALGYRLLNAGKNDAAISVFKMNVKAFPKSWNVYDSLGEAYYSANQVDEAISHYEYSLKLGSENPKNANKILDMMRNKKAKKEKGNN